MCDTNANTVTLQDAVLEQVKQFVDSGEQFSVYNVTTAIRTKCNAGLLDIPEVLNSNPHSQFKYDVRHDSVKATFAELFEDSPQNGFPALTRQFSGQYWVYEADAAGDGTVDNSPIQVVTSVPAAPATAPAAIPATPPPPVSETEVKRRIKIYLENCTKAGSIPTPKQVQSAIKRNRSTGYSYDKITSIASEMGYTLDVDV